MTRNIILPPGGNRYMNTRFIPAKLSVRGKLTIVFVLIILGIMLITIALHMRTTETIRTSVYNEMLSNVQYYQQNLDSQIHNISQLQVEFFQDRKLPFLVDGNSLLNEYERREAYLSVQERLRMITGISDLVDHGVLYFPKTQYKITKTRIGPMNAVDIDMLTTYLGFGNSNLYFYDGQFFIARTGEVRSSFSSDPNYLLVITFSSDAIIHQLSLLTGDDGSGAFLFDEVQGALLDASTTGTSPAIIQTLLKDENGNYLSTQRVYVGNQSFLVLVQPMETGAILVQYTPEDSVMAWIYQSWLITGVFLTGMLLVAFVFLVYVQRVVHRPLNTLSNAFSRVENGDLKEHIHHDGTDEFAYIYSHFNGMEDRLCQLIDEVYVQKNLVQKAQLKQLQAQINPHFLYNSFFILSRRIQREDIDGAVEMAQHLGDYFKYVARDQSDDISLKDEVDHARSYAAIQGARFASRLRIEFDALPEAWAGLMVPRLILQPLLENAFKYSLENISNDALLRITFNQVSHTALNIVVEDNGNSMADPEAMQRTIEEASPDVISGLGNIHRRLQIYYQGSGGLKISKSELGGIRVTLTLPHEKEASV